MLGLYITLTGCVLGFTPVKQGGVSCGSAFNAARAAEEVPDCDDARSSHLPAALALAIPGVILIISAGVSALPDNRKAW
jgi:hypothetical protein